jgi:hypothetical protein
LFSGHKFFRLEVQDATPPRTQRHCKKIIGGLRDQQTIWLPDDNLASLR